MINAKKSTYYFLELINCYAVVYYSNFIFFYMKKEFGFTAIENLLLAALHGIIYTFASWQGGKFARNNGSVTALYYGFSGMILTLLAGMFFSQNAPVLILLFALWTVSVCFTWPPLEALVSENSGSSLSTMVGLYNVTWAGGGAVAYFTAGILLDKLGILSLFWVPLIVHIFQIIVLLSMRMFSFVGISAAKQDGADEPARHMESGLFLKMAWLSNPSSYIAINTLIPLIPSLAGKFNMSTSLAGVVCSVWMFARLSAFGLLWFWKGWHYRFRWLVSAFVIMIISFTITLMTKSIATLVIAEIAFGLAVGLIYYSSLFYSMDVSEEMEANGGLHEAVIGAGLFIGPAIGAGALYLLPAAKNIGTWSVGGLLTASFAALLWMGRGKFRG